MVIEIGDKIFFFRCPVKWNWIKMLFRWWSDHLNSKQFCLPLKWWSEIQTIQRLDCFRPFKFRTNRLFWSPLYDLQLTNLVVVLWTNLDYLEHQFILKNKIIKCWMNIPFKIRSHECQFLLFLINFLSNL